MSKKMFIICVVLAMISSCKNYASGEDLKQNLKEQVEGFLDTKKEELFGGFEKPEAKVKPKAEELVQADEPQGQGEDQVVQGVAEDSESKENGIDKNDQELQEEIEKEIKELKDKIDKADPKNISIRTYSGYEKKIKELKGKLEEKLKDEKDKEKFKNELETLEKTLKDKMEKRKKELEEVRKKFQEFKEQVDTATGGTYGQQVKGKGSIGFQAWQCAKNLGLSISNINSNTDELANKVIDDSLEKIEEELKSIEEESKNVKK
ncbi:hypothetical protein [Borreliella kurtenbachii]|uniref:hypothetical protein n=1 Tax=Borreliella kurtenbachii TaxID=1196056 RepID=UPI003462B3AE